MGSENDKKQLDVEVDRLSSLPDDLIHKILAFNDTLHAVKTSSLSSRWRYIWTTMTCLAFSTEDFPEMCKFLEFVNYVLSGRDNQRDVSSMKLTFCGEASQVFVKRILDYAFSHNVRQLEITCLVQSNIEFPLSLFSSQTLKHLNLNKQAYRHSGHILRGSVTLTSTWEVPVLTTLHLKQITLSHEIFSGLISKGANLKNLTLTSCKMVRSKNIDFNISHSQLSNLALEEVSWNGRLLPVLTTLNLKQVTLSHEIFSGLISNCANLKNLTLTSCKMVRSNNIDFNIFHSQLSNLALEEVYWNGKLLTVVAPRLKNLIIRRCANFAMGIMISAPDLSYLVLQCYHFINFSADYFPSLEKADISIAVPYIQGRPSKHC